MKRMRVCIDQSIVLGVHNKNRTPNGYRSILASPQRSVTFHLLLNNSPIPWQISAVLTQGRAKAHEYVTAFMISYSLDAYRWQYLVDQYGNQKVRYQIHRTCLKVFFRYFQEISMRILFGIIISMRSSLHVLLNFILFDGILIHHYEWKFSVVKVWINMFD